MSNPQATYGIAITADDKTAKGAKSAEKRLSIIPKHVSAVNKRYADEADRSVRRTSRGLLSTFGKVEQASARAFGGRSFTSGITTRLGAVREAAAATGQGLGEAATAGSALEGSLAAIGVTAGATLGVLAAAGYAAYRLADGWAKGAASIGRTADIIGVASKQLQEFNAAAERQGVDQGTATSAVGGLSQSLNDARYGRNNDAVALLSRLGVKMRLNKDGTVDTGAMLPLVADALARQNSSGRRTAARILGIPEAALPAFTQGGKALSADMKDADSTAYIATPGDIAAAKRIQRKQAIVGQIKDRAIAGAGRTTALAGEGALDATVSAGRTFASGATSFDHAVSRFGSFVSSLGSGLGVSSPAFAAAIRDRGERSRDDQVSPKGARGVMQVLPSTARNPGYGIRPAANDSTAEYNRVGEELSEKLLRRYGGDQALAAAAYNAGPKPVADWIRRFGDPRKGQISDADFIKHIPYSETRHYAERVAGHGEIPVKVKVELVNAPKGTKATATAGKAAPAVSYAMAH